MRSKRKLLSMLTVVALAVAALTAALVWGGQARSVAAAISALQDGSYKAVSDSQVAPGQSVTYMIVVDNSTGGAEDDVVISDHFVDELSYETGSHAIEPAGTMWGVNDTTPGSVTYTVDIPASTVVTITFNATLVTTATPASEIGNVATISSTTEKFTTDPVTFTVSSLPGLQIFSPENGALLTQRQGTDVTVSGQAWAEFDPAPFPGVPTLQPIDNFNGGGVYFVEWLPVDGASFYVMQESVNGGESFENFSGNTVFSPSTQIAFSGKSVGTYLYRVRAYNASGNPSRWSNTQAVTVTNASALQQSEMHSSNETLDAYSLVADAPITVHVSIDGGAWQPVSSITWNADGYWEWSYDWVLPEVDDEIVEIKARTAYAAGSVYEEDAINVRVNNAKILVYLPIIFKRWPPVPYAPTLDVSGPDGGNQYTLDWVYGSHPIGVTQGYQIEEATDAAFTQGVQTYQTNLTTWTYNVNDKSSGLYYYRVRGKNSYGYGEWSNVVSVQLFSGYDFTSSTEGWGVTRSDEGEGDKLPAPRARDGKLFHLVWGKADFSIISPMEPAPSVPYTIRANVDIVNEEEFDDHIYRPQNGMAYGIIFGGNDASPCPATRYDPNGCLSHYYRLLVTLDISGGSFKWSLKRIDYHGGDAEGGAGDGKELVGWRDVSGVGYNAFGWNEWKIEVSDASTNNIKIYLNGHMLEDVTDHKYINDDYFGTFLASTKELGGVATQWDWFKLEK